MVDAGFAEREMDSKVFVSGLISLTMAFVCSDGDIAVHDITGIEPGFDPVSERQQLELPCAPPRPWRWKEMPILSQPEIEIPIRVKTQDRLSEKPLKFTEKLVDLRELFTCICEEILNVNFRVAKSHKARQRRAILATGNT
jgi:hypothetical protein